MSVRRAVRSLALLALTGPLAATLVVAGAPAALAAASWASPTPTDGQVLTANSFTVKVSVTAGSASVKLTLSGSAKSGGSSTNVCSYSVSSNGGAVSSAQTLTVSVPSSSTCSTSKNAQWTATLSGGATGTRTFYTNAAPAAPADFTAQGSGARDVAFTWTKGSESDLTGYALYEGSTLLDGDIGLSSCNGSTCSYGLYYSTDKPGDHTYQLAALRTSGGCSGCGSTVESSSRASAGATLVEPPKPSPTPSPTSSPTPDPSTGGTTGGTTGDTSTGGSSTTGGGSTGGSSSTGGSTGGSSTGGSSTSGGSSTGGTTRGTSVQSGPKPTLPSLDPIVAQRRAFALRFNAFSPSLGIPKLPPLPAITLPNLNPGEAPLPLGTFNPQLPYQPVTETEKVSDGTLARPVAAVRDVLDSERLARSIAGALILLLIGAHLRRFLGAQIED